MKLLAGTALTEEKSNWRINIASDDVDYVSETLSRLFAPCIATPVERSRLDVRSDLVAYDDFVMGRSEFTNGIRFNPSTEGDFVLCHVPISGSSEIRFSKHDSISNDNLITFCNARTIKSIAYSAGRRDIIFMARVDTVRANLATHLGYPIRSLSDFVFVIDKSSLLGSAFFNYTNIIMDLLFSHNMLESSNIKLRRCKDAFIELAVASLGKDQLLGLSARGETIALAEVAKAEDFMFANRKEPIGVSDVAAHLGISVRALQYSFKRYRHETPLSTLMRYRLEGLRDELVAGGDRSVAEIAASWGFVHPSRLSLTYRKAFGESPRETVKRGRLAR